MKLTSIIFLFFLLNVRADDFVPKTNFYKAKVLRVHDGDTIYVDMNLISNLRLNVGCRFLGVAAPELSEVNGKEARKIVESFIKEGDEVIIEYVKDDKFAGRIDSKIWLFDKINNKYFCLNDELLKNKSIFAGMDKNGKKIK